MQKEILIWRWLYRSILVDCIEAFWFPVRQESETELKVHVTGFDLSCWLRDDDFSSLLPLVTSPSFCTTHSHAHLPLISLSQWGITISWAYIRVRCFCCCCSCLLAFTTAGLVTPHVGKGKASRNSSVRIQMAMILAHILYDFSCVLEQDSGNGDLDTQQGMYVLF